jgi:SAM-dependent methyltransferase
MGSETTGLRPPEIAALPGMPGARRTSVRCGGRTVDRYEAEFWTARQRQAHSLHELSYRACFKPQLPRFFIERLTGPGDLVYDPFSGRGTTALEAALLDRRVAANDVNPLSALLSAPRLAPPANAEAVAERLADYSVDPAACADIDLSMFYHPATEAALVSLRRALLERASSSRDDDLDRWIRMVATNRLTGHSRGFFSVYTLPPNQAASPAGQHRINALRGQTPPERDVNAIVVRKTRQLIRDLDPGSRSRLARRAGDARFLVGDARHSPALGTGSVRLTVTSPPFLDQVAYAKDNWLRCWFNGLDAAAIGAEITMARTVPAWTAVMADVFRELYRVTAPGGHVAFEVGEVRRGTVTLDEHVAHSVRRPVLSAGRSSSTPRASPRPRTSGASRTMPGERTRTGSCSFRRSDHGRRLRG